MQKALELGINFFDTAQAYALVWPSACSVRHYSRISRDFEKILLLRRKVDCAWKEIKLLRDASDLWIRQGVEQSLRNLGVDYIDLYQIHWPDPNTPLKKQPVFLDQLIHEGKIRYVGVSNYNVEQMRAFEKFKKLDALQPPNNLFLTRY